MQVSSASQVCHPTPFGKKNFINSENFKAHLVSNEGFHEAARELVESETKFSRDYGLNAGLCHHSNLNCV